MPDFAGDFVLPSDPPTPSPSPQNAKPWSPNESPSWSDPGPSKDEAVERDPAEALLACLRQRRKAAEERSWRMPNFEAMNMDNPARHPAVNRCVKAAAQAFAEGFHSGQTTSFSVHMARAAFAAFMPDPIGEDPTREYIACVAYGVQSHMIEPDEAARLLYAAQIALSGTAHKRKS